ncbi:MAG: hypothetical protein IJK65_06815 [Clostridiales bacterium]|nr:hypothetical protein [Clostridiales bacterium]
MKLVVMNCKNCNAPLHLIDGKLVCEYCDSVTEIQKDSNDEAFERVANAEEYIRRALDQKKENLQKHYQELEAQKLEKEAYEEKLKKARRFRSMLKSIVKLVLMLVFIAAILAGMIYLVKKSDDKKKEQEAARYEEMLRNKPESYRLTKTELLSDSAFEKEAERMALEYLKDDHKGSIYEAADDGLNIWSLQQEPELVEKYLITSDRGNGLYFFYKLVLETDDGLTKEGYDCVVISDIFLGKDGRITTDGEYWIHRESSDSFDYYFGLDFDLDSMRYGIVEKKKADEDRLYFVFDL